jgi:hypothetical protein
VQPGVDSFLSSQARWLQDDVRLALTHIVSRAVYPASELKTARRIRENSAVCGLTGFPVERITEDRLYRMSNRLYTLKDGLGTCLSHRTNELSDIQDKIITYDLTGTCFEGEKRNSQPARSGRSKEKRSNAESVVLAPVINPFGFIGYSSALQGNISDPATPDAAVRDLRGKTSATAEKALVVIDAGIATEANPAKLRPQGYDYLCVRRSKLKDCRIGAGSEPLTVEDCRKRKIRLQKTVSPSASCGEEEEYRLTVESGARRKKEPSMNGRFRDGFLKGLEAIAGSLAEKGGVKQECRVHQRVGRLMQKYPSIHRYYQIDCPVEEEAAGKRKRKPLKRTVTSMRRTLKPDVIPSRYQNIQIVFA